jgi:hypothetical protein
MPHRQWVFHLDPCGVGVGSEPVACRYSKDSQDGRRGLFKIVHFGSD